ncbi:acyl carrier protein [Nocardiopsis sp. CA-288880]|uniref:acyl carrier protein n=1 Tax=Nocardiopsis sp. CA-288880 TaxID=3239995 RepID=UPI003D980151
MNDDEARISAVLADVLSNGLTADGIDPESDLVEEHGLDSLQMISFLLGIEDAFDIELDYENLELDDLRSVRQFTAFVAEVKSVGAR